MGRRQDDLEKQFLGVMGSEDRYEVGQKLQKVPLHPCTRCMWYETLLVPL